MPHEEPSASIRYTTTKDPPIHLQNDLTALNDKAWRLIEDDHQQAFTLATQAVTRAIDEGDPIELAKALRAVGACEIRQGDHHAARDHLQQSAEVLREHDGDPRVLLDVYRLLVRTHLLDHRLDDALRDAQQGLQSARAADDVRLEAVALNDIGIVYANLDAYPQALDHLLASVNLLDRSGAAVTGSPLNNIGNIYLLQEHPEDALDYFERARETFRADGRARDEALALGNLGRAHEALGQLNLAIAQHERAVDIARTLQDRTYLPSALTKLGAALTKSGRLEEARACLEEASALFDRHPSAYRNETRLAFAELHLATQRPDEAAKLLNLVLNGTTATDDTVLLAGVHEALARAHESLHDPVRALEHHRRYHGLHAEQQRALFSAQTRATLLQHEIDRAQHEKNVLEAKNTELEEAYRQLRDLHDALERQAAELERLGFEDALTGLRNRRALEQCIREEVARMDRYGGTFSVLMLDIDDFKRLNDTYSHAVGDEVLTRIGTILRTYLRDVDVPARLGGEEFVVLLPTTGLAAAATAAEHLRYRIEKHSWHEIDADLRVTASIGVVQRQPGDTVSDVLATADSHLYQAKREGKNRVVIT